jgi:hypothetical protein
MGVAFAQHQNDSVVMKQLKHFPFYDTRRCVQWLLEVCSLVLKRCRVGEEMSSAIDGAQVHGVTCSRLVYSLDSSLHCTVCTRGPMAHPYHAWPSILHWDVRGASHLITE